MGEKKKKNTDSYYEVFLRTILILSPLFLLVLFGMPSSVLAEVVKNSKNKGSEIIFDEGTNQVFRKLYHTVDFRPGPLEKKKFLEKVQSLKKKEFSEFVTHIFTNNVYLNLTQIQKIQGSRNDFQQFLSKPLSEGVYKPFHTFSPGRIKNSSLGNILKFTGGFLNPLQIPGILKVLGDVFKVGKIITKKIEPGKESDNVNRLPLPGPLQNPVVFLYVTIFAVILIILGPQKTSKIPIEIKETFFPPRKKSWTEFLQSGVKSSLTFLVNNPQYTILLFLVFYFRKQIIKIISDKDYRDEFTTKAFDVINKQQEAIQRVTQEHIKRAEKWAQEFYGVTKDFGMENLRRIGVLETQLARERKEITDLTEKNHSKDLALTTNRHTIETCSREYNDLRNNFKDYYDHTQRIQEKLRLKIPDGNELPSLPQSPPLLDSKRNFEYTEPVTVKDEGNAGGNGKRKK